MTEEFNGPDETTKRSEGSANGDGGRDQRAAWLRLVVLAARRMIERLRQGTGQADAVFWVQIIVALGAVVVAVWSALVSKP